MQLLCIQCTYMYVIHTRKFIHLQQKACMHEIMPLEAHLTSMPSGHTSFYTALTTTGMVGAHHPQVYTHVQCICPQTPTPQ